LQPFAEFAPERVEIQKLSWAGRVAAVPVCAMLAELRHPQNHGAPRPIIGINFAVDHVPRSFDAFRNAAGDGVTVNDMRERRGLVPVKGRAQSREIAGDGIVKPVCALVGISFANPTKSSTSGKLSVNRRYEILISWDTASKTRPDNDWSVATVWLLKGGFYYLLEVVRRRVDYPGLRALAIHLAKQYKPTRVLVEDTGVGTPLIAEAELFAFPGGRHDDQVDSISLALAHRGSTLKVRIHRIERPDWGPPGF